MSRRRVALFIVLLIAIPLIVVAVPLPHAVLRRAAVSLAPWLLNDDDQSSLARMSRTATRIYFRTALSKSFAGNARIETDEDEIRFLAGVMARVREHVLPPRPVELIRHETSRMPATFSGIGYCDQINGIIATAASSRFEVAELFALYDSKQRVSPHTIGRVWSKRRDQWLYYDAFYSVPVIFVKNRNGKIVYLLRGQPDHSQIRTVAPSGLYDLPGWKLGQFRPTFLQYVIARLRPSTPQPLSVDSTPPVDSTPLSEVRVVADAELHHVPALNPVLSAIGSLPVTHRDDAVFERIAHAYVSARFQHLLDKPDVALYRKIARDRGADLDDRASELASAAGRLADTLDAAP